MGEVARRTGVTVRTLHHYEAIGLLVPSGRTASGYREYAPEDIDRLARIVAYRACGLPLASIAEVLDAAGPTRLEHLRRQVALLDDRIDLMTRQRAMLAREEEAHVMGIELSAEDYFAVFGDSDPRQYATEAEASWGGTDAFAESQRRTSSYGRQDWEQARSEWDVLAQEFRDCLLSRAAPDSSRSVVAARAHRDHVSRWYYECTVEIHAGLADMYVADPRFAANFEELAPGLAAYVRDAIYAAAMLDS